MQAEYCEPALVLPEPCLPAGCDWKRNKRGRLRRIGMTEAVGELSLHLGTHGHRAFLPRLNPSRCTVRHLRLYHLAKEESALSPNSRL
jgi:hypothetical protein